MIRYSSPLLSIITPCLNRVEFIAETVESVISQNYPSVEHIVIDGGSTDGTLEVLSHYPHLKVYSEPDHGIYDAINKGILKANGDIIGLLNTDDLYEPDVFTDVVDRFVENRTVEAVLGGVAIFKENIDLKKEYITEFYPFPEKDLLYRATIGVPSFNGWFFKKSLFETFGLFNTNYKYVADRDFLIRLALGDFHYCCLNRIVYYYRQHPGSITFNEGNNAESDFILETRAMAESYICNGHFNLEVKKHFQRWHSQITTDQTLYALSMMRFMQAWNYARYGCGYNRKWIQVFIPCLLRSGVRVFSKAISELVN